MWRRLSGYRHAAAGVGDAGDDFGRGAQLQPVDVIEFNLPALSWTNKLLEIAGNAGQKFKIRFAEPPGAESGDSAPALFVELPVNETDPSVYEWDPYFEELNPYDIPAVSGGVGRYIVAPPTSVAATSDLSTSLVQPNGTVIPRIELTWTEPADVFVQNGGSIEIQMCAHSSAAWQDVLLLGNQYAVAFLGNVVSGNAYDLRIRSVRSTGATSVWVEIDNVVCGFALGATGAQSGIDSRDADGDHHVADGFRDCRQSLHGNRAWLQRDLPAGRRCNSDRAHSAEFLFRLLCRR